MADDSTVARSIEAVWRIESAKVIARLTRLVGDVAVAEELAQDTFLVALQKWRQAGVPDNPGAWLMTTAKYLAVDALRRKDRLERKHALLGVADDEVVVDFDAAADDNVGDDLLGLMFMACHPVLSPEARVALTLRLLGGLTTDEIARGYLVSEATVAQRIVRAKRTLTAARVRFELPDRATRADRLESVLEVVYLVFNEGYAATAGDDWMRTELCAEAMRLGRVLAGLVPEEPEVHGLVALMEIQASRMRARTGPTGEPILLLEQNRTLWDQILIRRGLAALERVDQLGGTLGPYALQAAIAAAAPDRPPTPTGNALPRLRRALAGRAVTVVEVSHFARAGDGVRSSVGLALDKRRCRARGTTTSCRGAAITFKLGRHAGPKKGVRAASLTRTPRTCSLLQRAVDSARRVDSGAGRG